MPESTFRTFEADAANEFASRLAQAAVGLDTTYSPMVLFGELGGVEELVSPFDARLDADSQERFIKPVHCLSVVVSRVRDLLKYEE